MTRFLIIAVLVTLASKVFCQNELKIYGGLVDYPGISFEHIFENGVSIELGSSFRTTLEDDTWEGGPIERRYSNLFINSFIKKYNSDSDRKFKFFYGAYLRFWQDHQAMEGLDNMTPLQQATYDNGYVSIILNDNKISFGGLVGFKLSISNKFKIGFTSGLGFSPKKLYWVHTAFSGGTSRNVPYEYNDTFGILFHLSGLAQISVGYVFNSTNE